MIGYLMLEVKTVLHSGLAYAHCIDAFTPHCARLWQQAVPQCARQPQGAELVAYTAISTHPAALQLHLNYLHRVSLYWYPLVTASF
jgi:hypothetical protein